MVTQMVNHQITSFFFRILKFYDMVNIVNFHNPVEKRYPMTNEEIKEKLYALKDEQYRMFTIQLLPGVKNMIGVRLPEIRKLSRSINSISYLELPPSTDTFEEIMLQGMVIGNIKDISILFPYISRFLPLIDNWSICDSFCSSLKITKKYPTEMFDFLKPLWKTNEPFILRFCCVMSLQYFLKDEFIDLIFQNISEIENKEYYVLMAISWFLSIAYKTYPDKVKSYLNSLEPSCFIYQKTIQKILELKGISQTEKNFFRTLKNV